MVTTRRSSARVALANKTKSQPGSTANEHSAIEVIKTVEKPCCSPSGSPDPPHDLLDTICAESDSELLDLSLLPPSTGNTPEKTEVYKIYSSQLKREKKATSRQTQILERPIPSNAGSAHNPISLLEDSPPPQSQAQKRSVPEPHQFIERHRKLYRLQTQTPPYVSSRSASGSPHISDLCNDIHDARARKAILASSSDINGKHVRKEAACQNRYPSSAQYTMQQPRPANYLHWQHSGYGAGEKPLVSRERGYSNAPETLRDSRADQTGAFDITATQLTQLIECNATLTSLLQAYPYSTDQGRLGAEISTLASVQNRCVQDWMRIGSQAQRKRSSDSAIDLGSDSEPSPLTEEAVKGREVGQEKRKKQDDAIRAYLSSHANIWQDGSGTGVSDVFGGTSTSSLPAVDQME
jgi:hypothetical protein